MRFLCICGLLLLFNFLDCPHTLAQKKLVIPGKTAAENNFKDPDSEFSFERRKETENFVLFWDKEFGNQPGSNFNSDKRFDADRMLSECERFFKSYVEDLQIVKKGRSVSDKNKILIFVTGGDSQTAYGWGQDSTGILWTPATRVNKEPYGVLAHELGHTFQFLASVDNGGKALNGAINEMGAQYLLWQVLPDWLSFENYHLKAYLKQTQLAFLHPDNAYHAPFMIEYWAEQHGEDFYGKLLGNVERREDPVIAYKRIFNVSQQKLNEEVFDAARRFVTWDLKRIQKIASRYRNQNSTTLTRPVNGWYQVFEKNCPQDYGYNAIELEAAAGKDISLQFEGVDSPSALGWHYGFVAYTENEKRTYSAVGSKNKGSLSFKVPADTKNLWLVVSAAPLVHHTLPRNKEKIQQFPYRFSLKGSAVAAK